jgi:hypothetical protein
VLAVNCVPPPLTDVYHPAKLYPLFVGAAGRVTVAPLAILEILPTALPPRLLKVTVKMAGTFGVVAIGHPMNKDKRIMPQSATNVFFTKKSPYYLDVFNIPRQRYADKLDKI